MDPGDQGNIGIREGGTLEGKEVHCAAVVGGPEANDGHLVTIDLDNITGKGLVEGHIPGKAYGNRASLGFKVLEDILTAVRPVGWVQGNVEGMGGFKVKVFGNSYNAHKTVNFQYSNDKFQIRC